MTATGTRALELARSAGIEHHIHAYESPPRRGRERDDRPSYGLDAATALHVVPARVFKTLVAEVDDRIVLAVVPVDGELDLKRLADVCGTRRAVLIEPAAAERATGYVVGGISPLGTRRPVPVVIDTSALAFGTVFISAGRRGLQLELAGADLVRLADATVAVIARPPARQYHASMTTATSLPFTGDDDADRLLVDEPFALLVGFALDQQVTVQKAFSGPAELKRRLGHLDAARIATMDPGVLDVVFCERPALHRFPSSMAGKVQALAAAIANDYGNDARRVWAEATDGKDLEARLLGLPGIGAMKAKSLIAVLGLRLGVRPPGYDDVAPTWPTLGDVDSAEALATYQAGKRAHKAALRAAAGD